MSVEVFQESGRAPERDSAASQSERLRIALKSAVAWHDRKGRFARQISCAASLLELIRKEESGRDIYAFDGDALDVSAARREASCSASACARSFRSLSA